LEDILRELDLVEHHLAVTIIASTQPIRTIIRRSPFVLRRQKKGKKSITRAKQTILSKKKKKKKKKARAAYRNIRQII
jgi:hypothetical protein